MTIIDHTNYEIGRTGYVLSLAARVLRVAHHATKVRSERAALRAMPDYLLKDVGIARSEIDHFTSVRYVLSNTSRMSSGK